MPSPQYKEGELLKLTLPSPSSTIVVLICFENLLPQIDSLLCHLQGDVNICKLCCWGSVGLFFTFFTSSTIILSILEEQKLSNSTGKQKIRLRNKELVYCTSLFNFKVSILSQFISPQLKLTTPISIGRFSASSHCRTCLQDKRTASGVDSYQDKSTPLPLSGRGFSFHFVR